MTEIFEKNLAFSFNNLDFKKKDVQIIKFKSYEISMYIKDMLNFIQNKSSYKNNKSNKQATLLYKYLINKYDIQKRFHGKIRSYFSKYFLKRNFKYFVR